MVINADIMKASQRHKKARDGTNQQYESISINRKSIIAHFPPIVNEHDDEHDNDDNDNALNKQEDMKNETYRN